MICELYLPFESAKTNERTMLPGLSTTSKKLLRILVYRHVEGFQSVYATRGSCPYAPGSIFLNWAKERELEGNALKGSLSSRISLQIQRILKGIAS